MKNNFIKNILLSLLGVFIFSVLSSNFCFALGDLDNVLNVSKATTIATQSGYSTTSVTDIFSKIIQVILGLSGTVAVILVILSGFNYLMSKGDPGKIKKALAYMTTGSIGIILMVSAYTLSGYIIKQTQRISGINKSSSDIMADNIAKCTSATSQTLCESMTECVYSPSYNQCVAKNSVNVNGGCIISSQCKTNICYNGICNATTNSINGL